MASIEEEFNRSVTYIQGLANEGTYKLKRAEELELYGLHQQATIGPCKQSKPKFFQFDAKAKWNSWMSRGQISMEDAKRLYVDECRQIRNRCMAASAAQES